MAAENPQGTNGNGGAQPAAEMPVELRAAASQFLSELVGRYEFALQHGLTFDGRRDLYASLGYRKELTLQDYRERYARGDIAQRIVEAYPKATWISGAQVYEDEDPDVETEFEKGVKDIERRLSLWSRMQRADILCGLGTYSIVLIGAKQNNTLASPLPKMRKSEDVIYLTPLPEERAKISSYITDSKDPRFGLPEFYEVTLSTKESSRVKAHWTRVIHVAEGLLDDDVLGKPRLKVVWNRLDDLDKLVGAGCEAAWMRMNPGMQLDIDPNFVIPPAQITEMEAEIEKFVHGLSRTFKTRGVKMNPLSASVATFGPNVDTVLQLISAATGVPKRILSGSEMGELASSQDRNNWNDRVSERRREFAEPLVRGLLDRLIEFGALSKPKEDYEIDWQETEEATEQEKYAMAGQIAAANAAQKTADGKVILTSDEIRESLFDLEPLPDPEPEEDLTPPLPEDGEDEGPDEEGVPPEEQQPTEGGGVPKPGEAQRAAAARKSTRQHTHRVADRHAVHMERAFRHALAHARGAVDAASLAEAIRLGRRHEIEREMSIATEAFASSLERGLPADLLGTDDED